MMRKQSNNQTGRPKGVLFQRKSQSSAGEVRHEIRHEPETASVNMRGAGNVGGAMGAGVKGLLKVGGAIVSDPYNAAFTSLYLFTLLLYARPNDLIPALGTFPLVKIVALVAPVAYISAQMSLGKPIIRWTLEVKMIAVILMLGILFMPVAVSWKDSYDLLMDTYIKTVIVFIVMITVVNSRERLRSLFKLVVTCGTMLAIFAIKSYFNGEFTDKGLRIKGLVGGMFENANDLATALDMLLPLAIVLVLTSVGKSRLFYLICTAIMAFAVLVTFSRGGFLGLITISVVMVWKFGRGRRVAAITSALLVGMILLAATPGGYGNRINTVFDIQKDSTGSAQERRELLIHTFWVAVNHPLVGVGMGNYHIHSIKEKVAHNSYLETAAELGVGGFLAYLVILFAPMRGLRRIERETNDLKTAEGREMRYISIALQAVFSAYYICSFFASIQYLWFLYYAAAYAVALRQIYTEEQASEFAGHPEAALVPASHNLPVLRPGRLNPQAQTPAKPGGHLWSNGRFRKKGALSAMPPSKGRF